jgi:putative ergosteryl-3beta-O-L-aspartate hydrolase
MSKIPTDGGLPALPVPGMHSTSSMGDVEEEVAAAPAKARPGLQRIRTAADYHKGDGVAKPPSRFSLRMTAGWWRSLQCIGMGLHFMAPPRPPNPNFTRSIPSTLSSKKGEINLHIYTPKGYDRRRDRERGKLYPAVVNFHGGGFTVGSGTDDARFARVVLETCDALFISVDYRLAPEFPFPTAVEDAADALLYLIRNSEEWRVDPNRLATSGFSAGGNLALTAPLRLKSYLASLPSPQKTLSPTPSPNTSGDTVPEHHIAAVVTWYPITDYTLTRSERRATAVRPEQTLPPTLTNLFDASYLYPAELDLADPYLSPSKASDTLLKDGIPPHVVSDGSVGTSSFQFWEASNANILLDFLHLRT